MPSYRGFFTGGDREHGRAPAPACLTERDFDTGFGHCDRSDPFHGWWVCTRPHGHAGDHVAHRQRVSGLRVLARWGPRGQLTDSDAEGGV